MGLWQRRIQLPVPTRPRLEEGPAAARDRRMHRTRPGRSRPKSLEHHHPRPARRAPENTGAELMAYSTRRSAPAHSGRLRGISVLLITWSGRQSGNHERGEHPLPEALYDAARSFLPVCHASVRSRSGPGVEDVVRHLRSAHLPQHLGTLVGLRRVRVGSAEPFLELVGAALRGPMRRIAEEMDRRYPLPAPSDPAPR